MRAKLFAILLTCWVVDSASAQRKTKPDSLLNIIASAKKDDISIEVKDLIHQLEATESKELESLTTNLINALTSTSSVYRINALLGLGSVYEKKGLAAWAIRFYREANEQAIDLKNKHQEALSLRGLSFAYYNQGLYTEALKYTYEGLKIFEDEKNYTYATPLLYQAALINYKAGNYSNCIIDFESCLKDYEKIPEDSLSGEIKFTIMSGWNTVGLACRHLDEYDKSVEAFQMALVLAKELQNHFWIALINGNKGYTYKQMGRLSEALIYIREDLRISDAYKQYASAGHACISLANIYAGMNNITLTRKFLDSAKYFMKLTDEEKIQFKLSYVKVEAKYFAMISDYPRAHESLLLQIKLNDSVNNEERSIQLSQIQARYNLEKKESEIQLLAQNNELQRKEIDTQRALIVGAIFFVLFIIAFLLYFLMSYRKLKKQNEIIALQREDIEVKNSELEAQSGTLLKQNEIIRGSNQELESKVTERTIQLQNTIKELDTFLYHASHDIRRPIATLLGLENISRTDPDNELNLFSYVADTARDMDSMLFKLQMAYRLNQPISDWGEVSLREVVAEVSKKIDPQLRLLKINIVYEESSPALLFSSPFLLMVIFQNVIENAINFKTPIAEIEPYIKISANQVQDTLVVSVEDNGIGIEEKYQQQIFDLYFRGTERSKGNGLGLYLTWKALEKMRGKIVVNSIYGKGSTFIVSIPMKASNT